MSYYSVIDAPAMVNGMPEDVSVVLANFQAIQQTVNLISDENISPTANIKLSKLEPYGTIGGITFFDDNLSVPGYIRVGEEVWARYGDNPVGIGHVGPAAEPAISLAGDTYLYRTGAGVLQTNTLHAANLQERSEKGQPGGYAPLDGSGHVPVSFIPDISATYQVRTEKGVPNGYASLDGSGKVPTSQLPPAPDLSPYQLRVEKGQPGGYASLDSSGFIPLSQLPPALDPTVYQKKSEKDQPSGYVGLDASSKIVLGGDTNLYRQSGGILKTDGNFQALNLISAGSSILSGFSVRANAAALGATPGNEVVLGINPANNQPAAYIAFGTNPGWDTNIHRVSPGVLRTDGTFDANALTINGVPVGAGALPPGGTTGQVLAKTSNADFATQWVPATAGPQGPQGPAGPAGGTGPQGPAGIGVPVGGTTGQALVKTSNADYATGWQTVTSGGSGLPADTVVPAATRIISNVLTAGDAQPAWRVLGSGKMEFGAGGTTAPDTDLYRSSSGVLRTGGHLQVDQNLIGYGDVLARAGSAQVRLTDGPSAGGMIQFGGAADTTLYRYGSGYLRNGGAGFVADGEVYVDYGNAGKKLWFGSAADTNLYRSSAQNLKTDGSFWTGGSLVSGSGNVYLGSSLDTMWSRAAANVIQTNGVLWVGGSDATRFNAALAVVTGGNPIGIAYPGDAQYRFVMDYNGKMSWGSGAAATDANLYRLSTWLLNTDGSFRLASNLYLGGDSSTIIWGSASDTSLYRTAANQLKTGGYFYAGNAIYANQGAATQIGLVAVSGAYAGIDFGGNTTLYRESAGRLVLNSTAVTEFRIQGASIPRWSLFNSGAPTDARKWQFYSQDTDGTLSVGALNDAENSQVMAAQFSRGGDLYMAGEVIARVSGGYQTRIGYVAGGYAGMYFGNANDTNLYRYAANGLKTDGTFRVGGDFQVNAGGTTQVYIGSDGKIYFGSANDTDLYRSAASVLKTDGEFRSNTLVVAAGTNILGTLSVGYIIMNLQGGIGARQFEYGPPDSAGSGYRSVRVAN